MTNDEQPDHTQDPRGTDTGDGYREEAPGGASPDRGRRDDDRGESRAGDAAPDPSSDSDGDPDQATGNRRAAG